MLKVCPVCQVGIIDDVVLFSHGKPGTKQKLRARVCQFIESDPVKRSLCINDCQEFGISDGYNVKEVDLIWNKFKKDDSNS